ncbi:MAG: autoinducer binding domain-containing protein [Pseudomonadota bacterium]
MELLTNSSIKDAIGAILFESDIDVVLKAIKKKLPVGHVCYFSYQKCSSGEILQFMSATYSKKWQQNYIDSNLMDSDPIVKRASRTHVPFFWSEIDDQTLVPSRHVLPETTKTPGNLGYSVPIQNTGNLRAIFSLNHSGENAGWEEALRGAGDLLEVLGYLVHSKAPQDLEKHYKEVTLSPREIECLIWTAKGKDALTISRILGISEHTGRDYLKSARTKLGCTSIAQAVYIGTKMGIIDY